MSPAFDTLSFITRNRPNGAGFNYWNVATTGSYSGDCLKGHELAAEYLAFVAAHPTYGNLSLLPSIVSSMIERAASPDVPAVKYEPSPAEIRIAARPSARQALEVSEQSVDTSMKGAP